jgi:hypothetical protein
MNDQSVVGMLRAAWRRTIHHRSVLRVGRRSLFDRPQACMMGILSAFPTVPAGAPLWAFWSLDPLQSCFSGCGHGRRLAASSHG